MVDQFISNSFSKKLFSLNIVLSGLATVRPPWNWETPSPPYSRLYYILDGNMELTVDGKLCTLSSGNVYLIPTAHSVQHVALEPNTHLYFHINLFDFANQDVLAFCEMGNGFARPQIEELARLYKSENALDHFRLKQEILSDVLRFLELSDCQPEKKQYSPHVQKAVEYIKGHLSAKLSVQRVCRELFISKSTLNRCFQSELGRSVGDYIDMLVLEQAKTLLSTTVCSLSQISDRLGFCDQFYFSRKFKAAFGETPFEYRQKNRAELLDR